MKTLNFKNFNFQLFLIEFITESKLKKKIRFSLTLFP